MCEHPNKGFYDRSGGLYGPVPRPRWRWTVSRWTSRAPRWGVEIRKRPRLRHSQIRLHLGRRHWTLMAFVEAKRV